MGYIDPSKALGSKEFKVCYPENVMPYYYSRREPGGFTEGKDSLRHYYKKNFDNHGITNESGYITFRFIINCRAESGCYEILEMGEDYAEKSFHPALTDELLNLTQDLEGWQALKIGDTQFDCYFHLTFKLKNGELVEILP